VWVFAALAQQTPASTAPAEPAPVAPSPSVEPAAPEPAAPGPVTPAAGPPNVLIVLLDDVGTDKIAVFGEHPRPPKTPVIDQLAREGVRFPNAYGYPLCSPTRAALMTGRYGRRNGLGVIIPWNGTWELPLDEVLLPELLESSGTEWSTAVIGKWHLSGPRTANGYSHPNRQGFDHAAGSINNLYFDDEDTPQRGDTNYFHWEKNVDGLVSQVHDYATKVTTDDALGWVATAKEPWFLYVPYNSAHAPFHAPPGSSLPANAPAAQRYAAMVEDVDREVGRLLAGLPAGQREHTLVVLLGDNGTAHPGVTPPRVAAHAKSTMFEGGTNVPLVVSGPGVFRGGTSAALVHVVDVLPTVAEWVGVDPARTGAPVDGVSFAESLRQPASPSRRRYVYTEKFGPAGPPPYRADQRAVRDDRYKLLTGPDGEWFYDLLGRDDDGPARRPEELQGDEKARYQALRAELDRMTRELVFAY
jgi:arylsulfatase B